MLDSLDLVGLMCGRAENFVRYAQYASGCGTPDAALVSPRDPVPKSRQERRNSEDGCQHGQDIHRLRLASEESGR
ncbi:hypothetical protein GCM10010052_38710 [Paenarthrobacter histidinolovorans]|nr:hypothetical protein GCM10010052_38710 [Paenarthrobacter histidinolovorans]